MEFGAKVAVSRVDGCFRIETLNWDSFNEGTELIAAIERYRQRYGCYPEAVLADKIYRNRANLAFCKEHGVRLSGPRLGRPGPSARADRNVARADNAARNGIESPFGIGKRRYGLDRIMAKLRCTAESVIAMQFLLLNLDSRVRFFGVYCCVGFGTGVGVVLLMSVGIFVRKFTQIGFVEEAPINSQVTHMRPMHRLESAILNTLVKSFGGTILHEHIHPMPADVNVYPQASYVSIKASTYP